MNRHLRDIIDLRELQQLTDELYEAVGLPLAILGFDGEVLTRTGWQDVCTRHCTPKLRPADPCLDDCPHLIAVAAATHEPTVRACAHGLLQAATPIVAHEEIVAFACVGEVRAVPAPLVQDRRVLELATARDAEAMALLSVLSVLPTGSPEAVRAVSCVLARLVRLAVAAAPARRKTDTRARGTAATRDRGEVLYRMLFETSRDAIMTLEPPDWRFTAGNPATVDMFRAGSESKFVSAAPWQWSPEYQPDGRRSDEKAREMIETAMAAGSHFFDWTHRRNDGEEFPATVLLTRVALEDRVFLQATVRDVSELKRAEAERALAQAELQQSQKMESVGRLAGGVAHDFNNMLGVILGYADLALHQIKAGQPLHAPLVQIQQAAMRSADLTRQLLAFARRQATAPRVLDINTTVEGMLKMLRRLIGEHIELAWLPGAGLGRVFIDPTQIDQILANLCVNARDAMPTSGRVVIETANHTVEAGRAPAPAGMTPGEYVLLTVRDDGSGMDAETLKHIFEPFFTTKPRGQGTGLGLATIYGIVRQNQGFIDVQSAPGCGTTFRVFLPRHAGEVPVEPDEEVPALPQGRGEIVLVVEDEPAILNVAQAMLQQLGYTVLAASTANAALRALAERSAPIDLLLTDVVMPGVNGRELERQVRVIQPEVKCLFMSGYAADILAPHEVMAPGTHFLSKPFTIREIALRVRETLDTA